MEAYQGWDGAIAMCKKSKTHTVMMFILEVVFLLMAKYVLKYHID